MTHDTNPLQFTSLVVFEIIILDDVYVDSRAEIS
jgi:hypothetical protein